MVAGCRRYNSGITLLCGRYSCSKSILNGRVEAIVSKDDQGDDDNGHDHKNGHDHSHAHCDHDHDHGEESSFGTEPPKGLGKNEQLVWMVLRGVSEPMKAYELLDRLKDEGVRAPMTIYRALDGLEAKGYVHKIEGRNAYMLCNHGKPHKVQIFLMCEKCDSVEEVAKPELESEILLLATGSSFQMRNAHLEIKGLCSDDCPRLRNQPDDGSEPNK